MDSYVSEEMDLGTVDTAHSSKLLRSKEITFCIRSQDSVAVRGEYSSARAFCVMKPTFIPAWKYNSRDGR
jgi:hypothetical protein